MTIKSDLLCILSGYVNATNKDYTPQLKSDLRRITGLTLIDSIGCYKGAIEPSVIVTIQNQEQMTQVKKLAKAYSQESVLIRHGDSSCELHYMTGTIEPLKGTLKAISAVESFHVDAFTIVNGQYWTIK